MKNYIDMDDILDEALGMLSRFLDPNLTNEGNRRIVASLKPRPEDYHRIFVPSVAEQARQIYEPLWANPPPMSYQPTQRELKVFAAWSQELKQNTKRAQEFPGGCAQIAHLLQPNHIFLGWRFTEPGHTIGMAYDGLVYLDNRFAWFPKPWKILADVLDVPRIMPRFQKYNPNYDIN